MVKQSTIASLILLTVFTYSVSVVRCRLIHMLLHSSISNEENRLVLVLLNITITTSKCYWRLISILLYLEIRCWRNLFGRGGKNTILILSKQLWKILEQNGFMGEVNKFVNRDWIGLVLRRGMIFYLAWRTTM